MKLTESLFATGLTAAAAFGQPNQSSPVQHVVVVIQENVSFDHYFGTYPNALNPGNDPVFVPRRGPAHPTPTVNGISGPLLTHNPNSVKPSVWTAPIPSFATRTTTTPPSKRP